MLGLAHLLIAIASAGCAATLSDLAVPPEHISGIAQPGGVAGLRRWGDEPKGNYKDFLAAEAPMLRKKYMARRKQGLPMSTSMLALSGGGDNGAFGAGLVVGWGERGDRPEFDLSAR